MGKKNKKEQQENFENSNEVNQNNTILAVPDENNKEISNSNEENEVENKPEDTKNTEKENVALDKNENTEVSTVNTENNDEPKKEKKSHINIIIILCIIIAILLICLLFSTIFALINNANNTIINGISIKNTDVSGFTKEQALATITENFEDNLSKFIILKHNDYETQITLKQLEVTFSSEDAVNEAYSKGRSGNIFKDNFEIIISLFSHTNITPGFSYSEDLLNSLINEIEINLSDKLIESNYYIEGNELIISKGKSGYIVDSNTLKDNLYGIISDLDNANYIIEVPVLYKEPNTIDINKIHSEICRDPVNAYYTTDPYVIYPHVDGIEFSVEEANNLLANSTEDEISIPLQIITPEITTNDIGEEAFPDELSTYYTTYSTNNVNRSTNIRLASDKINGTVVMPGEIFSYNITVGQRTTAAGFKTAAVYSGGEVTTGIGGGICQVSSTLYNAVLLANLEIVERQNHGFNTGYVPVSRDATVSWGGPDFQFKNTRNYPIKIVCDGAGGRITVDILGLKDEVEYDVEIDSYVTKWISYSTITRSDSSLEPGETKVIQNGSNGCRAVAYRILYLDGEEISRELLSQDTYSPHNKIVAVGE